MKRRPFIIAISQWLVTTILQIDRLFFSYDAETSYMIATKILYLFILLIIWRFIFEAIKRVKEGDEQWARGAFIFGVYFSFSMILLLILWPGTWSWDDLWTLPAIASYDSWHPWQHIITGAYQDVLLQMLPFPGGIILLQNIIISLCVAFSVTKIEFCFNIGQIKNQYFDTIIKLLPFFLPPVLMYQYSGYRIGLYIYLELIMIVILICAWVEIKKWTAKYMLLFCLVCIIVATWRTESFFYIPCTCLLVFSIKKNIIPNRQKILCVTTLIIGFLCVNSLQKVELRNSNYELVSLMRPCTELVRKADIKNDTDELAAINKVVDLEVIHNNPTLNGTSLYWDTDCVRDGYSKEDYGNLLKALITLSLKYPRVVIGERFNLFITGSGITGNCITNVDRASSLFDQKNNNSAAEDIKNRGWIAFTPVFKTLRKKAIKALGLAKANSPVFDFLRRLVWNAIIPELILLFAWIRLLFKKKWYYLGICSAVLIRLPVVILTQPSPYIMYVLSFYFLGYVLLAYRILINISKRQQRSTV